MKNAKKNTIQKISELGFVLLIIIAMFAYFKHKWNSKKQVSTPTQTEITQPEEIVIAPPIKNFTPEPPIAPSEEGRVKFEEVKVTSEKKLDPLLVKITNFSNAINAKYEQRLRNMFKDENKEEFMDKYLELRQERTMRMRELLKTNISRAANVNVNYEYHNKFYAIIGKDLYVKYLKILKETNEEALPTKIILEF